MRSLFALTFLFVLGASRFLTADEARLQLGDSLQIQVGGVSAADSTALNHEYTVDGDGNISLPYIRKVHVANLSIQAAQTTIEQAYIGGGYFNHPAVTITIAVIEQKMITVGGEVNKKGRLDYQPGMTILNAIKLSGGYTIYAGPTKVRLIRRGKYQIINCLKAQKNSELDVALEPGDNIQVPGKPEF